jgi:hypothetical protein
MANTIITQTIQDGDRDTIIKVDIVGDGSGDETKTVIFDASTYLNTTVEKKLWKIEYEQTGYSSALEWDAAVDAQLITIEEAHHEHVCWEWFGGYSNAYFSGRTGDILLTTTGLGVGDRGYIILYVKHRELLDGTR